MRSRWLKRFMILALTMAVMFVGAASAFADSDKGRGNGKGNNGNNGNNGKNSKNNTKIEQVTHLHFHFKDIVGADVEWALKYIASLSSKKVFEGFEDGTFRPRDPITRIQAIKAAVSAMGLGAQAESKAEMEAKLNFKDADKIPAWAVGYVSVALKNDLFSVNDDKVQPDKNADRLWFTTLMVKAMNLDDEARLKMNSKLSFKDSNGIPAGSVGYVQVAVDHKLISGYDDKTFRPNQPVTRAEAAKLLALAGEQIDVENVLKGTVVANVTNHQISITSGGKVYTYLLNLNTVVPVYRDNVLITLADIKIGDEVKLQTYTVDNQQYVYYIEVTKVANENNTEYTVSGKYNFFGANAQGQNIIIVLQKVNNVEMPVTYLVDPNVVFKTNGNAFEIGSTVKVSIKGGLAKVIEIIEPVKKS